MRILSLHTGGHDGTAVLFDGFELVAAVQLERLTRIKGDGNRIPEPAIDEVLHIAGIGRADIDVLLFSRMGFPAHYFTHWPWFKRVEYGVRHRFGHDRRKDMAGELHRTGVPDAGSIFAGPRFLADFGFRPDTEIGFYNHHYAHALSALFYTDWDEALLYTADGGGDNVHYSHHIFKDGEIRTLFGGEEELLRQRRVDSLGLAYGYATQALGYRINRHEGKLTGLAAYGEPNLLDEIGRHFTVDDRGRIDSDFADDRAMRAFLLKVAEGREPADVAASIQQVLEDRVQASVQRLIDTHGARHLGLAGGVFANVRLNRLLCETTGIDEVFIFPGMGDEGIPVGGALDYLRQHHGAATWNAERRRLDTVYLGRDHDADVENVLGRADGVTVVAGPPIETAAELLAKGWVGAIYTGRMEFGPRALGARSILGSPADPTINDTLNKRLQRTEFMPFAPYVLEDDAGRVFDITSANRYAASFMTITTDVHAEWREKIPAVVHVDGTARPQIIRRDDNPLYADILTAFKERTGLPVLINTSFNAHEEPIVNTPQECRNALLGDRIDFVVTDRAIYAKTENAPRLTG